MKILKKISLSILLLLIFTSNVASAEEINNDSNKENTNQSNTEKNVNSIGDFPPDADTKIVEIESQIPASVTGEKMEGSASVVDYTTTGAKAFYTIKDNEGNVFYLIIDMDKTENNVYFLKDVQQTDLTTKTGNTKSTSFLNQNQENTTADDSNANVEEITTTDNQNVSDDNNLGFTFFILIIAVLAVLGYYFFVMRKRKNNQSKIEDDDLEEDYDEDFEYYDNSIDENDNKEDK